MGCLKSLHVMAWLWPEAGQSLPIELLRPIEMQQWMGSQRADCVGCRAFTQLLDVLSHAHGFCMPAGRDSLSLNEGT